MIMLFHDSVTIAVEGCYEKMIPVGPAPAFEEVFANKNAEIIVCKPCAEARGISESTLVENCRFGGMKDFHDHLSREEAKAVTF